MTQTLESPPTTPLATPAGRSVYVHNMVCLWQHQPRLAKQLDAIPPHLLPALEATKDGHHTVRVQPEGAAPGGGVYLHSRYRPVQEARQWAMAAAVENQQFFLVCGFGLGYHVSALHERLSEDALLVIAEPNLRLLRLALEAVDLTAILSSPRVLFFTDLDRAALVERLESQSALLTTGTVLLAHNPSLQVAGAFHAAFQKLVTEFVSYARTNLITLMCNSYNTCRNVANNLGRYVTSSSPDVMANAFAGRPAILVAAGPSLAKNIHLLHEAKGRAVIIAVQTILKPLLAAGIEPDFVTTLDYSTISTRFFEGLADKGGRVHMVAEAKVHWNVLDLFQGSMTVSGNEFAEQLLRDAAPPKTKLKAGATVAHLSFYLAEHMGCDPIVLIGQDLGFVDGLYYKPGTAMHETWGPELGRFNSLETKEWERIVRSRSILRKIPDIHGHPMYTEEQFFMYLQQFERDFASTRARVIDATEGGARKQGVTLMPLREAIETFCKEMPEVSAGAWKTWEVDAVGRLEAAAAAVTKRQAEAAAMRQTCDDVLPLLEAMLVSQDDADRMRQLFAEVDQLRGRVGQDSTTFEMACYLNAAGEFKRFHDDLAVGREKSNTPAYQRRQIVRDIEHVKNLRIGTERLLEIIGGAAGRLGVQLAAAKAKRPWPREVDGGGVG